MRIDGLAAALVSSVCLVAMAAPASAQETQFNIAAGSLKSALDSYARQSGRPIIYQADQVRGARSPGFKGSASAAAALEAILANSGFAARSDASGAVAIVRAGRSAQAGGSASLASDTSVQTDPVAEDAGEIVVTAQKRSERLIDVPISMAVVTGDALTRSQATTLADLQNRIPGVRVVGNAAGSEVVIRGISVGTAGTASTATYVDDAPYGTVGPYTGSTTMGLNVDPYDVDRIEVLRGPQGTNYGANALAGVIKYVTRAPDPTRFAASGLGGISSVKGGGTGYELHGMVNVPLGEEAAFRIVGHDAVFPGFIDVPSRNEKEVNETRRYGFRASLLWQPSTEFSIRLSGEYQKLTVSDDDAYTVGASAAGYGRFIREPSPFAIPSVVEAQMYSAVLKWEPGFASITSSTSYTKVNRRILGDQSGSFGPLLSTIYGGSYGAAVDTVFKPSGFTQEVRASSRGGGRLRWTVGGYYTNADTPEVQSLVVYDLAAKRFVPEIQPPPGTFLIGSSYEEIAGFANASYDVTDRLTLGAGGRYSRNDQTFTQTSFGLLAGAAAISNKSSQDVWTYSFDAKYRLDQSNNIYARIASGFVPGGPSAVLPTPGVPSSFESSSTVNYEIGVKGRTGGLRYDLSAYQIDWDDLQVVVQYGNFFGTGNAGKARSRGVEGSFVFTPASGFNLNVSGSYNEARLTEGVPSLDASPGDRLPNAPFFSGAVGASYEHRLSSGLSGFAGFDLAYSSGRIGTFSTNGRERLRLDSYTTVDIRAGLDLGQYRLTLYVKNIFDEEVITNATELSYGGVTQLRASAQSPRTIGLTLSASY